jgi:hypothetical protein
MIKLKGVVFFLAINFIFISFAFAQEVLVKTDKATYARAEKIKVIIDNLREDSIFSAAATITPEFAISNFERKRTAWTWDAFATRCRGLGCKDTVVEPKEIPAGQQVSFVWKPAVYIKQLFSAPEPGTYRLTIIFQIKRNNGPGGIIWNTAKSNEFTLE